MYVIILTNRVHPSGKGSVVELRRRISAAVGAAFDGAAASRWPSRRRATAEGPRRYAPTWPAGTTLTGLDRLVAEHFARLAGRSVGLVTNHTGVDARGRRGYRPAGRGAGREAPGDLLPRARARRARSTPTCRTGATPRPVCPCGASTDRRGGRRPRCSPASTPSSSTSRTWARATTPISPPSCTCSRRRRGGASRWSSSTGPTPSPGRIVEGPRHGPGSACRSPRRIRSRCAPGMTIGEFARMVVAERKLPVSLTVVPLENWDRGQWFDQTGLPWNNPVAQYPLHAPGAALLGHRPPRGDEPVGGARHRDAVRGDRRAVDHESRRSWPTPSTARTCPACGSSRCASRPPRASMPGRRVGGVRFVVTDREAIRPVTVALALGRELVERYSVNFRPGGDPEPAREPRDDVGVPAGRAAHRAS